MSVGFLLASSRNELNREKFDSSFVGHTLWDQDGHNREIDVQGRNWRVVCLGDPKGGSSTFWRESETADVQTSFVFKVGWCYRITSSSPSLKPEDFRAILERFRSGLAPVDGDLGGNFVLVCYDAKRQRVAIQPDLLAMGTVYYAQVNGEIAASNRALRVANYFGCALDGYSVAAQMRGTHLPFGRSLFAGVGRLMGGSYLEIDLATSHAELKKSQSLFVPTRTISYADSVALLADTVKTAIRRVLANDPAQFDLTGGNDTRVLASAVDSISHNGFRPSLGFRVAGPEDDPDVRVARQITETCGWSLLRMDRRIPANPSLQELERAATGGDGNFPANSIWERVYSERHYADHGHWKTYVGAAAGELFRGFFYVHELLSKGRSSKINYDALLVYRTYASRGVDLRLFGTNVPTFEDLDGALMAPYRAIDEEGGSRPNTHKLDVMYLQRHCYRSGNTLSWLFGFCNLCVPFLSWELAGLGLSLPWKYRDNRELVQRAIAKLSPRLANIASEKGQPMRPLSLATLPGYVSSQTRITLNRASRVFRRMLGGSGEIKRSALPAPQAGYLALLDDRKLLPALFDESVIKKIRTEAASGQASRDGITSLHVLCSLELLLRQVPALQRKIVFD